MTVFTTAPTTYLGLTVTRNAGGVIVTEANEVLPRQQLLTSPYAYRAGQASSVDTNAITSTMIRDGEIRTVDIGAGAITTTNVADSAISTNKLADTSVTAAKLAVDARSVGNGQTWQNMTASRAINQVYQNTTGRPIQVIWSSMYNDAASGSSFMFEVSTNNSDYVKIAEGFTKNYTDQAGSFSAIIPNGNYYRFAFFGANNSKSFYVAELR